MRNFQRAFGADETFLTSTFRPIEWLNMPALSGSINLPNGPLVGRLTFVEDFTGEHSCPVLNLASIGISGTF
jgi:hypothetical protein